MIELTEPQVWTVIAVLAATLVAFVTASLTMITRVISIQFDGLRREMGIESTGLRAEMRSESTGLRAEMRAEFAALRTEMNLRMDVLDRDVQVIAKRVFGDGER